MKKFFYYIKIDEQFGVIRLIFIRYRCFFLRCRMTTA